MGGGEVCGERFVRFMGEVCGGDLCGRFVRLMGEVCVRVCEGLWGRFGGGGVWRRIYCI